MYRAYRVKETGQWCAPLLEDRTFFDDGEERAARVAATLGLAPDALEVVDADADPRVPPLLEDPNVLPPEPDPGSRPPRPETVALTAVRGASTLAQLRAAFEQYLTARGG